MRAFRLTRQIFYWTILFATSTLSITIQAPTTMARLGLTSICFLIILLVPRMLAGPTSSSSGIDAGDPVRDPTCMCCGQTSGRYCGRTLNAACSWPAGKCSDNAIYYCFSTYSYSQHARFCPGASYGHGGCVQAGLGSARCA